MISQPLPDEFDGGDPHGLVYNADELQEDATTILLMKDCGDRLEKLYPGYAWALQPDPRGGILNLRALKLHGTWGYVLKLVDIQHDPRRRKLIAAAGEILERFHQPRGPYNYEAWKNAPRDLAGDLLPNISDKSGRTRRRARDDSLTRAVKTGEVDLSYEDRGNQRAIMISPGKKDAA